MRLRRLVVLFTMLWAFAPCIAHAEDTSGGERLLFIMPDGWQEYASDRLDNISTTEYVPEGQDSEEWDEMLTIQIMIALTELTPEQVLVAIAHRAKNFCESFDVQPIQLGGVGDYPTVAMMMLCGKNKQVDRGEFMLLRGIAGKDNFYILQKSWRTPEYQISDAPPVPLEERKFWLGYLSYLRVCDDRKEKCEAEE